MCVCVPSKCNCTLTSKAAHCRHAVELSVLRAVLPCVSFLQCCRCPRCQQFYHGCPPRGHAAACRMALQTPTLENWNKRSSDLNYRRAKQHRSCWALIVQRPRKHGEYAGDEVTSGRLKRWDHAWDSFTVETTKPKHRFDARCRCCAGRCLIITLPQEKKPDGEGIGIASGTLCVPAIKKETQIDLAAWKIDRVSWWCESGMHKRSSWACADQSVG